MPLKTQVLSESLRKISHWEITQSWSFCYNCHIVSATKPNQNVTTTPHTFAKIGPINDSDRGYHSFCMSSDQKTSSSVFLKHCNQNKGVRVVQIWCQKQKWAKWACIRLHKGSDLFFLLIYHILRELASNPSHPFLHFREIIASHKLLSWHPVWITLPLLVIRL